MIYDEDNAIAHIRGKNLPGLDRFDDDQLLNIIDIIFDWQEDNGLLDINANDDDDDDDIDLAELTAYVRKMLRRDKGNLIPDELVQPIVEAELEYENSLDPFED